MNTIRQGNGAGLWHDLICEGEQRRHLALGEELQSYLVFALMRHVGDAALTGRVMALEWLQAHERPLMPNRLRDVGDRCLLIVGLFPRLALRRRVSNDYFVSLGRGAYAQAGCRAPRCEQSLFEHLSEAFHSLVAVLSAVRLEAINEPLPVPLEAMGHQRHLH